MNKAKVAVIISGNGSNLQALIDAAKTPDYPAEIVLVISNKDDAYGLVRAKEANIPAMVIDHKVYSSREKFDDAMHEALKQNQVEWVCLAGFMRILSEEFVNKWQGRMLNIHPSLLPDFKGANAIDDALAAGADKTGCTVHFVVPEMDAGAVLLQEEVAILDGDTKDSLAERIHKQEHVIYPEALAQAIIATVKKAI